MSIRRIALGFTDTFPSLTSGSVISGRSSRLTDRVVDLSDLIRLLDAADKKRRSRTRMMPMRFWVTMLAGL
jgi:hypothetical protein